MSLKKLLPVIFVLSLTTLNPVQLCAQEYQSAVLQSMSSGNAREISRFFDKRVLVTIDQLSNHYSTVQAEMVINEFFKKLGDFQFNMINHDKNNNEGVQLLIGQIKSPKGNFRTFVLFRKMGQNNVIQEVHFQKQ